MSSAALERVFPGQSELARRMRALDWSRTPLGPVERWPVSLRHHVATLVELPSPAIIFWGPEQTQLYNDGYALIMGPRHPQYLAAAYRECWPDTYPLIHPWMQRVLRDGEVIRVERTHIPVTRYGFTEEAYFSFTFSPVRDDEGRIAGILQPVFDVTDAVLSERRAETLRALAPKADSLSPIKDVLDALAASPKDVPLAVMYLWNESARVLDPAGPLAISDPTARGHLDHLARRAFETGTLQSVNDATWLEGTPIGPWPEPIRSVVALPIRRSESEVLRGAMVYGLSPRLRQDDKYAGFLELATGQVAAAIETKRALYEAQKRAEALTELDRAKTAFFSNVSHEFRTPLTLLLGPIEDALREPERALRGENLDTAYRSALRLLKLVNTLLDFARIEAGGAQARFEPTDLAALTSDLAALFRSTIERAGIAFDVRCDPVSRPVYVDRDMWEKVVLNLVSNALKFTFEGAIQVSLQEAGEHVELRVRDTGAGVAPEELPRIFERFHRVEKVRARTHEGSGIGLSLVRELVGLHGGEIVAESEVGRGTTFTVKIPFGRAHLPAEKVSDVAVGPRDSTTAAAFVEESARWVEVERARHAPTETPGPDASAPRILVVDDSPDMRTYIAGILGDDWRVETVSNGAAALDTLRQGAFDLVITDVMMPQLDGFGLVAAIRADPALRSVPVIMLSARAGDESRVEGLEAGADDYLLKPFSARELLARVRAQLRLSATVKEATHLAVREQAARREAELQKEHIVALFMDAPTPIVILRGPEHVIELANPEACRIWRRKQEDVVGKPVLVALPQLQGQGYEERLDSVRSTGMPYVGREVVTRLQHRRRDGSEVAYYFNFVYGPLRGVSGEIEGILAMGFDVTSQVVARNELERLRAEAESASRAKDEFLAMLGHELRNPLAPMLTAVQLLRMREMRSRELDVLERQVGHLTRLVDDLLDVSRITSGKVELRRYRVELAHVITRAVETASPMFERRRQTVHVDVAPSGLAVHADPERLTQVFSNLLTNAAKYSEPDARIDVRAAREGDHIRAVVEDPGVGIAAEMLGSIFDLFVQQPQTLDRSKGGLGLGLTIVRSLVEAHGGRVAAYSEGPGRGSEFVVELPAAPDAHEAGESAAAAPARPMATVSSRRILVVDDNEDAADMLRYALSNLGHVVEVAHDGPDALRKAASFQPEIAILDIGLPVMDGYELAGRLRALPSGAAGVRLVAVTGYGQDADRRRAAAAGFDEHLVKPVNLDALRRALAVT